MIVIIYRRLLTTRLHGKVAVWIANNARKQQKLGYNLEVHDVMKYTRKHRAINVTGAYVIIMLVYRRLLTTSLHGKAAV